MLESRPHLGPRDAQLREFSRSAVISSKGPEGGPIPLAGEDEWHQMILALANAYEAHGAMNLRPPFGMDVRKWRALRPGAMPRGIRAARHLLDLAGAGKPTEYSTRTANALRLMENSPSGNPRRRHLLWAPCRVGVGRWDIPHRSSPCGSSEPACAVPEE